MRRATADTKSMGNMASRGGQSHRVPQSPLESLPSRERRGGVHRSPLASPVVPHRRDKSGTRDTPPAGPVGTVLHAALLVGAAHARNVVLDPADCRALLADLDELRRLRAAGQQSTAQDAQVGKGGGR
ncbi:hypothetical protein Mx4_p08 [Myxococcus phage Mx4]|nr:hypothetical protein Mx4_p08 [Myxococcus phage Mx4]